MAAIDRNAKIEDRSKRFLSNYLNREKGWILREESPDYHIDYSAEIIQQDDPGGLRIQIQLKGTEKPNKTKMEISFPMDVSILLYYRDKVRAPVFLVVVDTINSVGWFIFIQEYLDRLPAGWEENTTKAIRIPITQKLAQADLFLEHAERGWKYMEEKYPGSPQAAIRKRAAELQRVDDRFEYNIDYISGQETTQLTARPGCDVCLNFTGVPIDPKKAGRIFNYGHSGRVKFQHLKVRGSPIFEKMGISGGAILNVRPNKAKEALLRIIRDCDEQPIANFEISIASGAKGFSGKIVRGGAIGLSLEVDYPSEKKAPNLSFDISLHLALWEGKRFGQLWGLHEARKLCSASEARQAVRWEIWVENDRLLVSGSEVLDLPNFNERKALIEFLHAADAVFSKTNRFKKVPKLRDVLPEDFENAEMLHSLMVNHCEYNTSFNGRRFTAKVNQLSKECPQEFEEPFHFKIQQKEFSVNLLEETFILGPLEIIFEKVFAEIIRTDESKGELTLTSTGESMMRFVPFSD